LKALSNPHPPITPSEQPPPTAQLIIADQPLALSFRLITVSGALHIGVPTCPIASALTATVPGGEVANGVDVTRDGSYDVHGTVQGPTWTRIAETVRASTQAAPSKTIRVKDAVQWAAGDRIVLVTTYWKDEEVNQNEVLTVAGVTNGGTTITVVEPIQFNHYGGEYQAEVGLLTRRILFTSDATSESSGIGPHTTTLSPNARLSGAAFERWGARNMAGKYSFHYHLAGDAPAGFVKNNAFYNTNWR